MKYPMRRETGAIHAVEAVTKGWFSKDTLSILLFHRVLAMPDPLLSGVHTAYFFSKLVGALRRYCNPLPLAAGLQRLADGDLPPRAVCITFDDGYADNLQVALPILQRFDVPATVFVTTAFLDGNLMWNDRVTEAIRRFRGAVMPLQRVGLPDAPVATLQERRAVVTEVLTEIKHRPPAERSNAVEYIEALAPGQPARLMLSTEQLQELSTAGVEIGAHTHSHPILATLADSDARNEIAQGKRMLEEILQQKIRFFAYPNGRRGRDYVSQHVSFVREAGFDAALTTDGGANRAGVDRFQLQRFTPWDSSRIGFLGRMIHHRGAASMGPRPNVQDEYQG